MDWAIRQSLEPKKMRAYGGGELLFWDEPQGASRPRYRRRENPGD